MSGILNDDIIKQINDDLFHWGRWVESFRPVQGHRTLWAGKDETRRLRPKARKIELYECEYEYAGGQAIAAHPRTVTRYIQPEVQKMPKDEKGQVAAEEGDEVALEIDGYLCQLEIHNYEARKMANHIYRWHEPRELILQKMDISKDRYYRLAEYIPVFVMGRRLQRMSESG